MNLFEIIETMYNIGIWGFMLLSFGLFVYGSTDVATYYLLLVVLMLVWKVCY